MRRSGTISPQWPYCCSTSIDILKTGPKASFTGLTVSETNTFLLGLGHLVLTVHLLSNARNTKFLFPIIPHSRPTTNAIKSTIANKSFVLVQCGLSQDLLFTGNVMTATLIWKIQLDKIVKKNI